MAKTRPLFSERNIAAQLRKFYNTEFQDLEDAAGIAIKAAGTRLQTLIRAQARRAFKKGNHPSAPNFPKAFKAYHLKPKGVLGYATYIRSGVEFMKVFELRGGRTRIAPGKSMIVRLPSAEKLGLPRVTPFDTPFKAILADIHLRFGKANVFVRPANTGPVLMARTEAGLILPLYQFRKVVKVRQRLEFFKTAERVGAHIPKNIKRIIGNG